MGCIASRIDDESTTLDDKQHSNKASKQGQNTSKNIVKTLILGTGESGKTTFVKQLNLILDPQFDPNKPDTGFSLEERARHAKIIRQNILECLSILQENMITMGVQYENASIEPKITDIIKQQSITGQQADDIAMFWKDGGVQTVFARRGELYIPDNCPFFMENISRVGATDYSPSNDDILHCRMKTTGVQEYSYSVDGTEFMFIDVGGQKSERRKWLSSFNQVTSVIYVASLSDYDLKLIETSKTENRMRDSVQLWEYIVNHETFKNTLMIIFLNKRDLFEEKFDQVDFSEHIQEYESWMTQKGKTKCKDSCLEFIEFWYRSKVREDALVDQKLIFHKTIATNTKAVEDVFNSIKQELIVSSLRKAGMM